MLIGNLLGRRIKRDADLIRSPVWHAAMIAQVPKSFLQSDISATFYGFSKEADGDVSRPPIKPVNDTGSRADLPVERNQDCDRGQGTGDHATDSAKH
jgi:hypothetical protein